MKRDDAIFKLRDKLKKSKNLFDGYKNGNLDIECLCTNLSIRVIDYIEYALRMLPPEVSPIPEHIIDNCKSANYWELKNDKAEENASERSERRGTTEAKEEGKKA